MDKRKEARGWLGSLLHDKGILVFIVFVPLAYPLLYSWVYTREVVREVPAVVVDECHSERSREFTRLVDATPDVRIVARCRSVSEAQEWLSRGQAYGIYRIPATLERDLRRGDQASVGLYASMCSMLYYKCLLMAAIPPVWRAVSWAVPSTFGMNGYVRLVSMGCSLVEARPLLLALWGQAAVYLSLAAWLDRREQRRAALV